MMLDNVNDFKPTKVIVLFYFWYDEFGVCGIFNYLVIHLVYFSLTTRVDETLFQFSVLHAAAARRVVPHDKQQ